MAQVLVNPISKNAVKHHAVNGIEMPKKLNIEEKLSLVRENCEEVITDERLQTLLQSKDHPVAYIGYEPSGDLHLGHKVGIDKMEDLEAAGFETIILLADMHAFLNEKGKLEDIRKTAKENKKVFEALGVKAKIVLGGTDEFNFSNRDGFQMTPRYELLKSMLASHISFNRATRSVRELARYPDKMKASHIIYPIMQVADIVELGVDLAVGGKDQRQIHMLADDSLPKLGHKLPVFLHMPMIRGTKGSKKMSSSDPQFLIALNDSLEKIEKKINNAFCPPRQIEDNPVLAIARYHLFRGDNEITIGSARINSYNQLEKLYAKGEITPKDLKKAVPVELSRILEPVRKI